MKIKFEPRDLWIGLYWRSQTVKRIDCVEWRDVTFYLCLVPCFPIIWTWERLLWITPE